jgi:PhnB protein
MSANPTIVPMLSYEDGVKAIEWLCAVFGFTEQARMLDESGRLAHGEITMGTGTIMLASPTPHYESPKHHREHCGAAARWSEVPYIIDGTLVYVSDVQKHFDAAVAGGARILTAIETGGPGARYRAEDLEGHRWMFMELSFSQ